MNVFYIVSSCEVYGTFFFAETTIAGINYLDVLQLWLMPQLQEDSKDFIFEQDGAPPHLHFDVRFTSVLISPVVGLGALLTVTLLFFPGLRNHLTKPPAIFFLWGYIKERLYVPPMPRDLPQLRQRFVKAVASIDRQMSQRVWQELDYRIDINHVTKGGHIEHL